MNLSQLFLSTGVIFRNSYIDKIGIANKRIKRHLFGILAEKVVFNGKVLSGFGFVQKLIAIHCIDTTIDQLNACVLI